MNQKDIPAVADEADSSLEDLSSAVSDPVALAVGDLVADMTGLHALGPTLDTLIAAIQKYIDTDECVVALADRNQKRLQEIRRTGEPAAPGNYRPQSVTDLMGEVDRKGSARIVTANTDENDYRLKALHRMAVPLGPGGDVVGAVGVARGSLGFEEQDLRILEALVTIAAPRISNCLAEERLNRAVLNLENAQTELERTQIDYRSLFECHPSLLFMLEQDSRIMMINDTACSLLRAAEEEITGLHFDGLVSQAHREASRKQLQGAWEHGNSDTCEIQLDTAGETQLRVRVSARRVSVNNGRPALLLAAEDITESWELQRRLRYEADHDSMTGLMNKSCFERRLHRRLSETSVKDEPVTLLGLDLDFFKEVNDNAGHAAGDELLRRLSEIFSTSVRGADVVARLGGDEFALLLNNCDLANGHRIAESIRSRVENLRFRWGETEFDPSVSIGLVLLQRGDTVETALSAADSACYAAKRAGRNQVRGFSAPDMDQFAQAQDIDQARQVQNWIREERFELHHQPIVRNASVSNPPVAYEVLIRCRQGKRLLYPEELLPAEDRLGVAGLVDRWVIGRSLEWLSNLAVGLDDPFKLVINLWARSIADQSLGGEVIELISGHAVAPEQLVFEVPHTCLTEQSSALKRLCSELGSIGCRFGLDDVGADLSIFEQLQSLPFVYIKLDPELTNRIVEDRLANAKIRAILGVAKSEGIEVGAKRVENSDVAEALWKAGISFMQGYETGRPREMGSQAAVIGRLPVP